MASIYANRVEAYGRLWHRPWMILLLVLASGWALHWLLRDKPDERQIACEQRNGSRYRSAVEIDGLIWTADMEAALACAVKHDRQVLVAFHAITDTNARVNEMTIFRNKRVQSAMRRYVLVMLQIDLVPEEYYVEKPDQKDQRRDGESNLRFEEQMFKTAQEPLYVVLQPTGNGSFDIVAEYDEARINDSIRFIRFLDNPGMTPNR